MRPDLALLTDDVLIDLANKGLVKRAHKMLDRGDGPQVSWDGAVPTGTFSDGVLASLPVDVGLAEASCTCGAPGICRHRLALVLACRGAAPAAASAPAVAWTPSFSDDALRELLGDALVDRAERHQAGVLAELVGGVAPEARLPTCTVRFLVPGELGYAQCSCDEPRCQHIAHAVWAFRRWDEGAQPAGRVELAPSRAEIDTAPLDALIRLADDVAWAGVSASSGLAQRLAAVERDLVRAGLAWPLDVCLGIAEQLGAYRRRSALYEPGKLADLLVDPWARRQALGSVAPDASILGASVAAETRLEKARFIGLGCRIQAGELGTRVEIFLAEARSGTVLVLRRELPPAADARLPGPSLRKRQAGGVAYERLATGRVLTQVARRRANRELLLGSGAGNTSVTTGDWGDLPASLAVTDLAQLPARPPASLRPRHLADAVRVLVVDGVDSIGWDPAEQTVVAVAHVGATPCRVVLGHTALTPGAGAALIDALNRGPTRISGHVRRRGGSWEIEPLAVQAGALVVPALAPARAIDAPLAQVGESGELTRALVDGLDVLDEGSHQGLSAGSPSWNAQVDASRVALARVGLATCAACLETVAVEARAARVGGQRGGLLQAWRRARIRLGAALERA